MTLYITKGIYYVKLIERAFEGDGWRWARLDGCFFLRPRHWCSSCALACNGQWIETCDAPAFPLRVQLHL